MSDDFRGMRRTGRVTNWLLKWVFLGPALRVWLPARLVNREVLDTVRGAVIVSNHQSFVEHLLLPLHSPRHVQFWAKTGWWGRGLKGRAQGLFFTLTDQMPLERRGGDRAAAAIEVAADRAAAGDLFCIYPEGTRTPDGAVHRGHTGAVRVAARAEVPLIPCAVVGLHRLQPRGRIIPRPGRFTFVFGEPVLVDPPGGQVDEEYVRTLTDDLMREIARLGALPYKHEYSTPR